MDKNEEEKEDQFVKTGGQDRWDGHQPKERVDLHFHEKGEDFTQI